MNGRVAIMTQFNADFQVREYPVPDVEPDAALIKISTEVVSHVYPIERISEAFREAEWLGRQHDPHKLSRAAIAPWGR